MTPEKGKLRPTPPKAYLNPEFMGSPQARSIRVLTEMTEPHVRFKKHNVRNTVVMFGSARTLPPDVARKRLEEAKAMAASGKCDGAECAHRLRVAELLKLHAALHVPAGSGARPRTITLVTSLMRRVRL